MINNKEIEQVSSTKFLGLTINEKLSWKEHMNGILVTIQRNLGIIYKIRRCLNRNVLMQLYYSLIFSHIKYGIVIWHHGNTTEKKKIQVVINKFMRIIYSMGYRESVRAIMAENKILSLNQLFTKEIAIVQQKLESDCLPKHFKDLYANLQNNSSIVTRSRSTYNPSFCRSLYFRQNITHIGPKIWNNVPERTRFDFSNDTVVLYDIKKFKTVIHEYCTSSVPFYENN